PDGVSPLDKNSWAVVVTYEPDGYVSDKDAEKINYSELLTRMQKSVTSASEERQKTGYEPMHFVNWAKEVKFGSQPDNTLNYNIRMPGRGEVLVLNGVAVMSKLPEIEQATPKILAAIDFQSGTSIR